LIFRQNGAKFDRMKRNPIYVKKESFTNKTKMRKNKKANYIGSNNQINKLKI